MSSKDRGEAVKKVVKWSLENNVKPLRHLLVICPRCGSTGYLYYHPRIGWYVKHRDSNTCHSVRRGEALEVPLHEPRLSLIWYIGGDTWLLPYLSKMIPPHHCYVEVFGGGAPLLLNKPPSPVEIYNDIDGNLVNLFKVVKEHYDEFMKELEWVLYSRSLYYELLMKINYERDMVKRAVYFFLLLRMSHSGIYGSGFDTSRKTNEARKLFGAIEKLRIIHRRLKTVIIESLDFREILQRYDDKDTFFYLDPPHLYLSTERGARGEEYYQTRFTDRDFLELLNMLENIKGYFLLKQSVEIPYLIEWANEHGFTVNTLSLKKSARHYKRSENPLYKVMFIANYRLKT